MHNTHPTNPSGSLIPHVLQDTDRQNIAAGENLSQNASPSRSYEYFEFSGENNGSTGSRVDSLSESPSGSRLASDHARATQTAPLTASDSRVRERGRSPPS
jgi:hypothetical protein